MTLREKVKLLPQKLEQIYEVAPCALIASNDYELLFATILSAQCTDKRVNECTKDLFLRYDTLEKFANANISDVYSYVKPCGISKKATYLVESARMILTEFGGKVPDNIDDIVKLPGAGRKTANLILGEVYGKPSIIADTHCIRLANRFGLVKTKDPVKVEMRLKEIIPKYRQTGFCHRLVHYGRDVCKAQSPECFKCTLTEFCIEKRL